MRKNRTLSAVLAAVLAFSLLPAPALAEMTPQQVNQQETEGMASPGSYQVKSEQGWGPSLDLSSKDDVAVNDSSALQGVRTDGSCIELRVRDKSGTWSAWGASAEPKDAISALEVRTTDKAPEGSKAWYRVHVAGKGWLAWVSGPATTDEADQASFIAGADVAAGVVDSLQILLVGQNASSPASDGAQAAYLVANNTEQGNPSDGGTSQTNSNATSVSDTPNQVTPEQDGSKAQASSDASGGATATGAVGSPSTAEIQPAISASVSYQVQGQSYGWSQGWVRNGAQAGVTGKSKRLEAFQAKLSLTGVTGGIRYRAHVQTYGDQDWVTGTEQGSYVGTIGKSKRMEAIQIELTGDVAKYYDIYYQAHVQRIGWQGWVKNGQLAGTRHQAKRIEAIKVVLVRKGEAAPVSTGSVASSSAADASVASVTYQSHVQSIGNTGWLSDGAISGSPEMGKRIEAVHVRIAGTNLPTDSHITASAYVQGKGWISGTDGAEAGTHGQGRRIEALKFQLSDGLSSLYDVWYQVNIAGRGWLGWASNGSPAGTSGMGGIVTGYRIKLVPKNQPAPGNTANAYLVKPQLKYQAYVQNGQWVGGGEGATAGTTGRGLRVEALKATVNLAGTGLNGAVQYRVYQQRHQWSGWVSDGEAAGSAGSGLRAEAIQMKLTGSLGSAYDIWYRVHAQGIGWMGWTKNGASAGTSGLSRRIEAIQVRLVSKGGAAPGSTKQPFTNTVTKNQAMLNKARGYSSPTNWMLLINNGAHRVGVYQRVGGMWTERYLWKASVGKASTPTRRGVFHIGSRGYSFDGPDYTCYWWTQFSGDYLFHSVIYQKHGSRIKDGSLGRSVSHGCVRLNINNAKWINKNIPSGTTVVSY